MIKGMVKGCRIAMCVAFLAGCASSSNEDLESARFALDSSNWDSAITKATNVLTADPSNVQAALLLSSAYAGRAGIELLSISSKLTDTANTDNEFQAIHSALVDKIVPVTGLADLRSAIVTLLTTLTPQPVSGDANFKDQQFQLGLLEALESFALPSLTSEVAGETTPTVGRIADKVTVQTDFINTDDHLINGGLKTNNALVTNLRKNYCVLNHTEADGTGFTLAALRDVNRCQLDPNANALRGANGDFASAGVVGCSTIKDLFNSTACSSPGNTQ